MKITEIDDHVKQLNLNENKFSIFDVFNIVKNIEINETDFLGNSSNLVFNNAGYNKILIYDHPFFDIYVIIWDKSGMSKIHDHSENGCIFRIIKGIVSEQIFNKKLERISRRIYGRDIIGYIDNSNGYHKISNVLDEYSISLHLYSPREYIANTFD